MKDQIPLIPKKQYIFASPEHHFAIKSPTIGGTVAKFRFNELTSPIFRELAMLVGELDGDHPSGRQF